MNYLQHKKFDDIYTRYFHNICYFCTSYLGDAELGKDVAQEIFVNLWDRMDKIETNGNILPYLVTMAKNRCINILTRKNVGKKYHLHREHNMTDDINAFALHEMSASTLYQKEIMTLYRKALESMPPKTRETFLQIRVHGSKYKEIADKSGISVKALEYHITKATLILRKFFRDYVKFLAIIITSLKHLYE